MGDNLVERLRELLPDESEWEGFNVIAQAADEIEQLRAALGDALDEIWVVRAYALREKYGDDVRHRMTGAQTLTVDQWLSGERDALTAAPTEEPPK